MRILVVAVPSHQHRYIHRHFADISLAATMSSLRNAIPRRPHKERSQETSRARFGLLEKHKDYSKRARDFNVKKARLRILRQKATDRNPDEFHFAMLSSRMENGVKVADRGNKSLSDAVTKLLKTQDAGYLRTMINKVRRERGRLDEVTILGKDGKEAKALNEASGARGSQRTVYVDDEDAQLEFAASAASKDDSITAPVSSKAKSPREREADFLAWKAQKALEKKQKRQAEANLSQYEAVKNREKELLLAEQELGLQRAKMNHNIGGINKNGVKFKVRERKR